MIRNQESNLPFRRLVEEQGMGWKELWFLTMMDRNMSGFSPSIHFAEQSTKTRYE